MSLTFHRKPLKLSANTLQTLIEKYQPYTEVVSPTGEDSAKYEEYCTAINLITGGIKIIKSSQENLQTLVDKLEKAYEESKSKGNKKDLVSEIEEIDQYCQFSEKIAGANDIIFVLQARINEYRDKVHKLALKLGIDRQKSQLTATNKHIENKQKGSDSQESIDTELALWLSDDASDSPFDREDIACRTLKPKQVNLPRFYGDEEEFPEYWAIFETLVNGNKVLNTVEKMLLLKDSLRGRAETAIKGIQLIPQNYQWMTEELKKKFGNKPLNRAKIVQKLTDMRPANNSVESCTAAYDKIRMLINQMVSAGQDIRASQDALWTENVLEKFPYNIVKNVLISIQNKADVTVEDVMQEIEKEITAKRFVDSRLKNRSKFEETKKKEFQPKDDTKKPIKSCVFCNQVNHPTAYCRNTDIQAKRRIVSERKLCWKCFSTNHNSFSCSLSNCPQCGQHHNKSLCILDSVTSQAKDAGRTSRPSGGNKLTPQRSTTDNRPRADRWRNQQGDDRHNSNQANIHTSKCEALDVKQYGQEHVRRNKEQIVLMTAAGNIWNHNAQKFEQLLFFFDSGAQKTLINEEIAQKFGLPTRKTETCTMSGIGGHIEKFQSKYVNLRISDAYGEEFELEAHTKPVITNGFPSVKLTHLDKEFLRKNEIQVCNPKVRGELQVPHILVGLDHYYDLVIDNFKTATPSGLRIAKTVFGPSLHGRGTLSNDREKEPAVEYGLTAVFDCNENEILRNLFELEGLGISSDESTSNDKAENYFASFSKMISFKNGHITAPFPLKDSISELCDNYAIAIRRLSALQYQLVNNFEIKKWYCRIIDSYIKDDVIEEVKNPGVCSIAKYYMPHSGVWRPEKAKPLRIVFDASSKGKGKKSLNDMIFKGESFINKIHNILISSRVKPIIILCDIEAAFTQIRIAEQHRDLCRFLWLKDVTRPATKNNITEYRFKRLPFGINASPSILNMAIMTYLSSLNDELAGEIAQNLYVDNILLSASTVEEAISKYGKSKELFAKIGMNLREYVSNNDTVNEAIPAKDRSPTGKIKFLGVPYNTRTDEFSVDIKICTKEKLTKRDIVSQLNSIYDPIGLAAPLLIKLKHLMREIYACNLEWKDEIPSDLGRRWVKACHDINNISVIIPRTSERVPSGYSLWTFCDASEIALATCSYLRSDNTCELSTLISGKTKLAPKKNKQTIPRLELLALLMGTRLSTNITSSIPNAIREVNVVTDSKVALAWIKTARKLPLFVSNQRDRIAKLVNQLKLKNITVNFYYIPTAENPADAGTRGLSAANICTHSWIRGPRWLAESQSHWPLISINGMPNDIVEEAANETVAANVEIGENEGENEIKQIIDLKRFSKLPRALRTIARVGKCLKKWIMKTNNGRSTNIQTEIIDQFGSEPQIDANDIFIAERLIILQEQSACDMSDLQKRHPQKKLQRDSRGVIRYISRLQNACLPEDTKSPIYIPTKSDLARLIVGNIHDKNAHCGREQMLTILRQRFWIPRPSLLLKTQIKHCVICRRCHGLPFSSPEMPSLPRDRVIESKAFEKVGCDFLGPIESPLREKMYVCLYTCLTTRALHLEVVENLSAGAFLNSFIRFISRRGVPKYVRSDCGTNFRLGQKVIEKLFEGNDDSDSSVMSYCATEGIRWTFNPPGAPWMGGVWERLVGSVKRALQKTIGRKRLTFIQLSTVMARIEAILNSRPITKVHTTDLSSVPLRPVDFLCGNVKFSIPETQMAAELEDPDYDPEHPQTAAQVKEALESAENISSKFWERWNSDYLTALRDTQTNKKRQKRGVTQPFPQVGEIVLIEQELIPRGSWVYGKVEEIVFSNDGQIRTVKVRMPNQHILQKPVCKLYPMEIRSFPESKDQNTQKETNEVSKTRTERKPLERKTKRLAYEAIKSFEEGLETSDEETHSVSLNHQHVRHNSRSILKGSGCANTILTMLLVMACAIHPALAYTYSGGYMQCDNGIVEIIPPSDQRPFEVCLENGCKQYTDQKDKVSIFLPVSPLNRNTTVTLKLTAGDEVLVKSQDCSPPEFCAYAQGFLSKGLLGNPHCWPEGAIISAFLVLYLILATILLVATAFWRKIRRGNAKKAQRAGSSDSACEARNVPLRSFNPTPLAKSGLVTACVIMVILQRASACQLGYMRHTVNLICTQRDSCVYEYNEEISFNRLNSNLCIQINHGNKTVGLIKVYHYPIKLTCAKVSRFFTRDSVPKIHHSLRCPQMGSCYDERCSSFRRNEVIPELSDTARHPGYSTCASACGGLSCGCLLPLPSCSFYRFVHEPISEVAYEVVDCSEWKPVVTVEIHTTLYNVAKRSRYVLQPYVEQIADNLKMTVVSIQNPRSPMMDRRFAVSSKDAVMIPENYKIPVECATEKAAVNNYANCTSHFECICHDSRSKAGCRCPTESISQIRSTLINTLPIYTPTVQINAKNKEIILSSIEAEVVLLLQSSALISANEYVIQQPCEIQVEKTSGCYDCVEGAQIQISCKTEKSSWITIQCEEQTFSIECNPENKLSIVNLNFNYAVIQKNCHTVCDGKQKNFVMEGTLLYHEIRDTDEIFDEKDTYVSKPIHWFQSLKLPDIRPLFNNMKKYWKVTAISAIVVMIGVAITYLFGPLIVVVLIRIIVFLTRTLPIIASCVGRFAIGTVRVIWITFQFTASTAQQVRNYVTQNRS